MNEKGLFGVMYLAKNGGTNAASGALALTNAKTHKVMKVSSLVTGVANGQTEFLAHKTFPRTQTGHWTAGFRVTLGSASSTGSFSFTVTKAKKG